MKRVVIIPTEKERIDDMYILERVLRAISPQVDDILLIKNHKQEKNWGLAYSRVIPSNVIQLHCEKKEPYMVASVMKMGFDYIADNYDEPVFLMTLGDDCIPSLNYVETLMEHAKENIICSPSISYMDYDAREVDYVHYSHLAQSLPRYIGHTEDVPSIQFVRDNWEDFGKTFIINGVSGYIWNPQNTIRPDESYNGNWGYEDSDFKLQKLDMGYSITHVLDARFWHIQTPHKKTNREPTAHKTPNRGIFKDKWITTTNLK